MALKVIRSKINAKSNEELDIQKIIEIINTNPDSKIHKCFMENISCGEEQIVRAYSTLNKGKGTKSGDRKTHYDFCIDTNQRIGLKIEHKGTVGNRPIDPMAKPWQLGVQWYNGSPKYSIMNKYLRAWYDYWMISGKLTEKYGLTTPVPDFDIWLKKDAMVQGNPTTMFGKELKQKSREKNGSTSSLIVERDEFMLSGAFSKECLTEEDLEELKQGVLDTANRCLQEKDLWIQVAGNLHDDNENAYQVLWSPKCKMIENIVNIEITMKKNVEFVFLGEDGFKMGGIMRWGKGQGFSNFRMDFK